MKKKPSELIFISQINRDGSGTTSVKESYIKAMNENPLIKDEKLKLRCLSITNGTYIAIGFNSFVVKLKKPVKFDLV